MENSCENHKSCVNEALSKAEMICSDQNVALTPIRKTVLEIVWQEGHNAIKAYDLLEKLKEKQSAAKPTTVYRALDFLIKNNLIHKLESENSYIGCNHPSRQHSCAFLICNQCGDVHEFCDNNKLMKNILSSISPKLFRADSVTLEVHGTCNNCL